MYNILYLGFLASAFATKGLFRDQIKTAETKAFLKKKLFSDILLEQKRLDKLEYSDSSESESRRALKEELDSLKNSLEGRFKSEAEAAKAAEKLRELKRKIREIEIDGEQCCSREESVRSLLETLEAAGAASRERELARIKAEFEKSSSLPFEERMLELQNLIEQLQKMLELKDFAQEANIGSLEENKFAASASAALPNRADDTESRRMMTEIRHLAGRIARIDASEGEKLRPVLGKLRTDTLFPDRLIQLRRQMKRTWGMLRERSASTTFFRETLGELAEAAKLSEAALESAEGEKLARRYDELCGSGRKFIERTEFMKLYEDIASFSFDRHKTGTDEYLISKRKSALGEMGYDLLPDELTKEPLGESAFAMRPGEVRYLESPYDGYRVMMKLDPDGTFSVRLVRVAASEEEKAAPRADQRQKDIETGQKWCKDFDGFLEKMSGLGLPMETTIRKEPEESSILVVVDKNHPATKKRRRGKKEIQDGKALNSY